MRRAIVLFSTLALSLSVARTSWAQAHFLRGDSNHDKKIDLSDGIGTLGYLFLGDTAPPCLDAADINDSGEVDIGDAIYTFNWLFLGGLSPAAPWPVFEADPTQDGLGCLGPFVDVSGDITEDTTWTADKVYRLVGGTFIKDGATLTVEAGTTVIGGVGLPGGEKPILLAERGGRLVAVGTPTHPVVFTTENPVGSRQLGDWGGVLLLGRSTLNVPGGIAIAEGTEGQQYGGGETPIVDDDSGHLSYVRIEYGGFPISPDNEVNALSMFAVGSGTQLDHIQVKFNDDDGFEWFGGAASLKYGLTTFVSDDMFDYSFGWQGNGQFWVGLEKGEAADNGMEVDNSESGVGAFTDEPRTRPTLSNVTLIGTGAEDSPDGGKGFNLRRGAGVLLRNFIIQGFKGPGFDLDDEATCDNLPDDLVVDYGVFYDNGEGRNEHWETGDDESGLPSGCSSEAVVSSPNNILATDNPTGMVAPYTLTAPDFRPQNDALTAPFDATTLGPFFDAAPYRGAVPPDGADWTQEPWISYQLD